MSNRTRRTSHTERLFVGAIALVAAVAANLGGAAPTGVRFVDLAYVGLAAVALTVCASRSRRWAWLVSLVAALWLVPTTPSRIAVIAAIALGLYTIRAGRHRVAGAAIGAVLALALGDLGAGPFTGSTFLLALVAAIPVGLSGAMLMPRSWRRPIAQMAGAVAAATTLATLAFGFSAILAISDVNAAIDSATTGFDLASDGKQVQANDSFDSSTDAFGRAHDTLTGFWTFPARLVPIVGQHARAIQVVTAEGVALSETAGEATSSIDPDDIRLVDGTLDLRLLQDLEPVLDRTVRALDRAHERVSESRNDWLVAPVQDRMQELLDELDAARPSAQTAALATRELPVMLGSERPVRWLVAMTTPAEARGLGGLLGNWIVVEARDGEIDTVLAGRNEDVNALLRSREIPLVGPAPYVEQWGRFRPNEFFQDVTLSPDLPMVAEVTANLFAAGLDTSIDGVIFVDPYAVSGVLALGGPVTAGARTLTAQTVVPFLLEGQYVEFADDEEGRVKALAELVDDVFAGITEGALPGPRAIADTLGPVIEQDRLGVWWAAGGGPADLLAAAGLDGRFPTTSGDLLGLVHQNAGQNKLDPYLDRALDYRLEVVDGRATATITVTLTNRLDDLTLPPAIIESNDQGYPTGTNVARVNIHTSLGLVGAHLDGSEIVARRDEAFGQEVIEALVEIPPGATRVLEIEVAGELAVDASTYTLTLPYQPLINNDEVTLAATIDGTALDLGGSFRLRTDTVVRPASTD